MLSCRLSWTNYKLLASVWSARKPPTVHSPRLLQLPSQISKARENTLSCGEKEVRFSIVHIIQSGTVRLSTNDGHARRPSVADCAHPRHAPLFTSPSRNAVESAIVVSSTKFGFFIIREYLGYKCKNVDEIDYAARPFCSVIFQFGGALVLNDDVFSRAGLRSFRALPQAAHRPLHRQSAIFERAGVG